MIKERKLSNGKMLGRLKSTVTIQLTRTSDRKYRLASVFFVWTKLAFRTLLGEVILVVAKRKVILSASLRSTNSTR